MTSLRSAFPYLCAFVLLAPPAIAEEDEPSVKDHPGIPRFPGTHITDGSEHDFGAAEFETGASGTKHVEGHIWEIQYAMNDGAKVPSPLELSRNYGNQFKKKGGSVVYEDVNAGGGLVTMKMPAGKGETWMKININNGGTQFTFYIVTTTPMEQKVAVSADDIGQALATAGHIAIYGILFDTGKSDIKPESAGVLDEIVKVLTKDAKLKLRVEGHTDNVGAKAANMKLSKQRAEAVKKWLVGKGVAAARLEATGLGDSKPLAPNDSDDARAKNRRVELAKK